MLKFLILLLFLLINCQSNIIRDEIKCLSDLPLSQLLKIQSSMKNLQCSPDDRLDSNTGGESEQNNDAVESRIIGDKFSALPLIDFKKFLKDRKPQFEKPFENHFIEVERSEEHWEEEKPTKLRQIFQTSITALSFLAFGAYLLCMIVQSIKSRGTTYYHPVATISPLINAAAPIKRIKVYRRSKRSISNQNQRKTLLNRHQNITKSNIGKPSREVESNTNQSSDASGTDQLEFDNVGLPDPEEMYKVLVQFAEGYVKIAAI